MYICSLYLSREFASCAGASRSPLLLMTTAAPDTSSITRQR